jgi:hypothetical protein
MAAEESKLTYVEK